MSESQMPPEDGKLVVQRFWYEVVNSGDLELVDELFTSDCIVHDPVFNDIRGQGGVREIVENYLTLFPDIEVDLDAQIAAADSQIVTRWFATGTHTGQIGSQPPSPTGERVNVTGMSVSRIIEGRIQEAWIVTEAPPPPPAGPPGFVDDWCRKFPWLCK
jgi:steroid delta-isomerase-like uncharacterized protein